VAVERSAGGFKVQTTRGEIRSRDVLVATNGYTGDAFADFRRRVIPMGSYLDARIGAMMASEEAPAPVFASLPFESRFFYRGKPWFLPLVGCWYRMLDAL